MKLVFVSNFLNHHQIELCNELHKELGDNFHFVATEDLPEERKILGYEEMNEKYPFVIQSYLNDSQFNKAKTLIEEAEAVIIGSAANEYFELRRKTGKLIIRYSERLFKKGTYRRFIPTTRRKIKNNFFKDYPHMIILAASAYLAYDISLMNIKNPVLKWGYFPEFIPKAKAFKKEDNKTVNLLWVGRLIDWKKPFDAIKVAKKLNNECIEFILEIIGTGPLYEKIQKRIIKNGLAKNVTLLGSMTPEKVREHMKKSDIFLFTSNFQEGWGAVLNEAMNSGCAIVVNKAIGSAPFLVKNRHNALMYNNNDFKGLYNNVKELIYDETLRENLGNSAYTTIAEEWNAKIAAKRLINITKQYLENKQIENVYETGICSPAPIISNKD